MVRLQSLAPSLKRRFQKLFGPKVEVIWIPTMELDSIVGDLVWIEDVMFDMAVRARTAMTFGGRLVIELANLHLDESTAVSQGLRPGQYVMLEMTCLRQNPEEASVCDATAPVGTFPDAWMHCDFAKAQAMISSLGGQICEYNEPGRALTIRAFFPSADTSSCAQDFSVNEDVKQLRILLVEDEAYVRDVACEILESEGYLVLAARTGKEALELFQQKGPVQLLLTDVIMPGMNGQDLSAELTSIHPELKTIFMSGYTDGIAVLASCREQERTFIQKPFTLEALTSKVKQVLDSPA